MTRLVSVSCAFAIGLSLVACKDQQACEQSRLEMAKTWKKVQENAASRAAQPNSDLPEDQQEQVKKIWGDIEAKAYHVHGSFQTTHVTWDAADQGTTDLQVAYRDTVPNKEDPMVLGFGKLLELASGQYTSYKESCR